MATAVEDKKDTERKVHPKAPETFADDESEGPVVPLAEALGDDGPPDAGSAVAAAAGGAEDGGDGWSPDMDWVMESLGPFFNNNQGIGELLLDKLKESGVNTEGVALAGLVNVLQQFSKELKNLNDSVGNNLQRINELSSENENLAQQLQEIISSMGLTKDDGGMPPMDDLGGGMDMGAPPAEDTGEAPPPDMGAPPGGDMGGGMPPDMGAPPGGDMGGGMPPDMGAPPGGDMGGGMPPDMGGGMDAGVPGMPPGDVPSDERIKRKIVSDRRLKRLVQEAGRRARRGTKVSGGIISACTEGVK